MALVGFEGGIILEVDKTFFLFFSAKASGLCPSETTPSTQRIRQNSFTPRSRWHRQSHQDVYERTVGGRTQRKSRTFSFYTCWVHRSRIRDWGGPQLISSGNILIVFPGLIFVNKKNIFSRKRGKKPSRGSKKHESHANKQKSSKNKILQRVPK